MGLWWIEPDYFLIWLPFIFILVFILYCIKHNQLHLPIFKSALLNRIYENVLGIFTGTSMNGAYVIHLVNHHKENNNEKDWGNTNAYNSKSQAVNLIKYALATPLIFLKAKRKWLQNTTQKSIVHISNIESWIITITYVVLLTIKFKATIMYIIIPHLLGQLILVSFNYFQHADCNPSSAYDHSRNFTGKLINYLTFNNGYHTVHHLYPALHWSEYNEIHLSIQHKIAAHLNENNLLFFIVRLIFIRNKKTTINDHKILIHESKIFQ
jgi:fatty acid desaturase